MVPTKEQIQAIKDIKVRTLIMPEQKIYERYVWPCCGNQTQDTPVIENAGENVTLVRCMNGCGFIYLEQWFN